MSESTLPLSDLDSLEQYLASIAEDKSEGKTGEEIKAFRESDPGKELAAWIKEKFHRCTSLRFKEERQWNLNLAFYNGNQWVEMLPMNSAVNAGQLSMPKALTAGNKSRERQTINRIKPIIRTEMAKFISNRPGASVIPATDEDEDILAAKAGEKVWESTSNRRLLQEEFIDAVFWMCVTGNGFVKTTWNKSIKDTDADTPGDVDYGSVDPYKLFFPDLKIKDIQAQPYIIHAYAKPVEWLEMTYKEALQGQRVTPSCNEAASITEQSYARPRGTDEKAFDSAMLMELWVKPGNCPHLPNGGMVIMVGDIIVDYYDEGIPYDHEMYPFSHLHHIKTERFYRASIIEDLIDLQRDYNKLRSQIAESRKKMAKPQLMAPQGSVVASKITNEIGTLIEYRQGMEPPQPMPMQTIPQYVLQEVEYIKADFEDISGQHEVSKGQTPTGVTAATAIAYLQESDDSFILPTFKAIESAYGSIAKQTLKLCSQFWDIPRTVKVIGKDEVFSIEQLSGADLVRGTDIRVEPGSSLPVSKAARQALVMDLMMNFPQDVPASTGLEMMEIGADTKLMDILKGSERQAKRENIRMKRLTVDNLEQYDQMWTEQMNSAGHGLDGAEMPIDPMTGMPLEPPLLVPVNDWDDHDVHIEQHNAFRRTQEFEALAEEIKTLFQSHVKQHESARQQKQLEQMLSQIPTDGSTPGVSGTMNGTAMDLDMGAAGAEGLPPEEPNAAPGAVESAEMPTDGGALDGL